MSKKIKLKAFFLNSDRRYNIGNVTYIVSSRFENPKENNIEDVDFRQRLEKSIKNDFAHLTAVKAPSIMEVGNVCLTVGKEE